MTGSQQTFALNVVNG